jgi:Mn-dependent DtxR family transcriptional regulator
MTNATRYLLVLYIAEQQQSAPIAPGYVAEALDRSPSATTEMFQRLADRGLVVYEPYEGATLTDQGRETASGLYDSYVTLSRFFRDVLDIDECEAEAMRMAGVVDSSVTDRLAETLLADDPDGGSASEPSPTSFRTDRS